MMRQPGVFDGMMLLLTACSMRKFAYVDSAHLASGKVSLYLVGELASVGLLRSRCRKRKMSSPTSGMAPTSQPSHSGMAGGAVAVIGTSAMPCPCGPFTTICSAQGPRTVISAAPSTVFAMLLSLEVLAWPGVALTLSSGIEV